MHYPFLDQCRGLAVLGVVCVHLVNNRVYGPHLPEWLYAWGSRGKFGVQLFFLISAITLCHSWSVRAQAEEGCLAFYLRRFFRIAPLYYLAVFAYALMGPVAEFWHLHHSLYPVLGNLFLLHGVIPAANNSVVPGGWSVGTEILFYALFPVLIRYANTLGRSAAVLGGYLLAMLLFSLLVPQATPEGLRVMINGFWYFNILVQLPVFLLGMVGFHLLGLGAPKTGWLVLALVVGCAAFKTLWVSSFEGRFLFAPLLSAGVLLPLALLLGRIPKHWATRPVLGVLAELGRKSFGIYLVHFAFVAFLCAGLHGILVRAGLSTAWCYAAQVGIVVFLSYLTSALLARFIENPCINLGRRLAKRVCQGRAGVDSLGVER